MISQKKILRWGLRSTPFIENARRKPYTCTSLVQSPCKTKLTVLLRKLACLGFWASVSTFATKAAAVSSAVVSEFRLCMHAIKGRACTIFLVSNTHKRYEFYGDVWQGEIIYLKFWWKKVTKQILNFKLDESSWQAWSFPFGRSLLVLRYLKKIDPGVVFIYSAWRHWREAVPRRGRKRNQLNTNQRCWTCSNCFACKLKW